MDVPREFRPLIRTSPVLDLIGPLYCPVFLVAGQLDPG